jgi:hypothetical protein
MTLQGSECEPDWIWTQAEDDPVNIHLAGFTQNHC